MTNTQQEHIEELEGKIETVEEEIDEADARLKRLYDQRFQLWETRERLKLEKLRVLGWKV